MIKTENIAQKPFQNKISFIYRLSACLLIATTATLAICASPSVLFIKVAFTVILVGELIVAGLSYTKTRRDSIASFESKTELEKTLKEISDYKYALEESSIVAITNQKGIITYANDNFCKISKYSHEELIGNDHRIINSGHHSPDFIQNLWKTIAGGKIWKGEFKNKAKDGSYYWVDTTIVPFLDNKGKPYQYLSIRTDISKRKNSEEALKISKSNLKTIFENTDSGYILLNNEFEIVSFNKLAEKFSVHSFGLSGNIGKCILDYFPAHRKDLLKGYMCKVLQGEKVQYEINYPQSDGKIIWFAISLFPINCEEKTCSGLIMKMSDITEKKLAEKKTKEAAANLSAIIENTDSAIYSLDKNLRYVTFNKRLSYLLKEVYNLEIKEGDHVFSFLEKLDPEELPYWQNVYAEALSGKTLKFEKEFKIPGFQSHISFSIYPIIESGTIIGLSCFTHDVTEQKKQELQKKKMTLDLIQRNKGLEQFSYIISHNLRAPVANILGLSQVLRQNNLTLEEKRKSEDYMFMAVEKLDTIVKDLNHVVDIKRDICEKREALTFSEVVKNIEASISDQVEKNKVEISIDFSAIDNFYSIKSYLHNIFYNLITNSIKYSQPFLAPKINIKSSIENGKLLLFFNDNGIGIDLEKHHEKLFGLYNQFHLHSEGKGMGLFLVKTQVETLGGKITVNSEVNKGTEFVLEFALENDVKMAD